jgi:hypothetical protein
MAVISLTKFSGVAPRVSPNKLPPDMAQTANNVRLLAGTLDAWTAPLTVVSGFTAAPVSTIYRYGQDLTSDTQYWFHWTVDVDIVKGAIANDQTERTYFTHPTLGPRMTYNTLALTGGSGDYPWGSHPLGVPAPTAAPLATVATEGDTSTTAEVRVYVYTFVTSLGEEGPPSPPSNALTIHPDGGVAALASMAGAAPTGYSGYITAKRIYRTLTGNLATEYQFVDEIPIAQSTYSDSIPGDELDEIIPSVQWFPPPSTSFGIVQMANGIMLVFDGYDIYPSEAYIPSAYPPGYSQAVDFPIVGGSAVGTTAFVLTTGYPYLLTGSDPSAMALVRLESPQSCVSKRSIAAIDGGVIYASPDGLIYITGTGAVNNVTAPFFSRREWQALVPSSIHGYYHEGRYHGFYNDGTVQRGFIFDPSQGNATFTFIDTYATAGFTDMVQDALYLKVGTNIVKWSADNDKLTYTWRSAIFEMPSPCNKGCAQVVAKSYPVTLKLYADGVLKHTQTVANADPFWLPSGYRARYYEVELSGAAEILSVHVADSIDELGAL